MSDPSPLPKVVIFPFALPPLPRRTHATRTLHPTQKHRVGRTSTPRMLYSLQTKRVLLLSCILSTSVSSIFNTSHRLTHISHTVALLRRPHNGPASELRVLGAKLEGCRWSVFKHLAWCMGTWSIYLITKENTPSTKHKLFARGKKSCENGPGSYVSSEIFQTRTNSGPQTWQRGLSEQWSTRPREFAWPALPMRSRSCARRTTDLHETAKVVYLRTGTKE